MPLESSALLGHRPAKRPQPFWHLGAVLGAAVATALLGALVLLSRQPPAQDVDSSSRLSKPDVGRFLHITDFHVDPGYVEGSTVYSQCHRRPPVHEMRRGDGHKQTGRYGISQAKCDTPVALVNATAAHLRAQWGSSLDYIVWTGDSGRHDGDARHPRTFEEILEGNRIAASALRREFPGIPVVPNIGNNDISPHNELPEPGHRRARRTFQALAEEWHGMIPDDQLPTFRHGGYFARDVIDYPPGSSRRGLTALSLNTIYWFRANDKVGGCRARDSPGLAQLAWIRYQLRRAQRRRRDVVLLGHVLPNRDNYRPTCYHGYARTVTQTAPAVEDDLATVHAQLFGHSNVDVWAFVGHEAEWIASHDPLLGKEGQVQNSSVDARLWWERQVDEESGRFGKLIRKVWAVADNGTDEDALDAMADERAWEDMEDDPPVSFAEHADGSIWPTQAVGAAGLPSDFLDTLLKEFKRVVVQGSHHPRLGVTTISPSIIPRYVPAYRVFYYQRGTNGTQSTRPPGTLLDYDVYWADLPRLNKKQPSDLRHFFRRLYRFSDTYGLKDLSIDSYLAWAEKILTKRSIRRRFRDLTYLDTR
ncbi:Endopolyphosphatase [Coemansia sp. RSA 552]|nr:Endopolyphosphatase [Coemansia sp. RSA 552]